jgi:exodeoxyribonuclease V alpha subunit
MCDSILMNQLLKKILFGTRVVFVGDIDQLASVGAGNVLADIIASKTVPTIRLTHIYRQDAMSKIITNAHAINNGQMPDCFLREPNPNGDIVWKYKNNSTDFFFENANSPAEIRDKVLSLVTERLPRYLNSQTPNIQVLCPMKAGDAGMTCLNTALQNALNPPKNIAGGAGGVTPPEQVTHGDTIFRLGDRVMQTQNNYQQEWKRDSIEGKGIFNGDMGVVFDVTPASGEIRVRFEDGRESVYTRGDLINLTTSYAITVHKSQGCEFDAVVIPVTSGAYMILTRNLLYTAVTRAKRLVMLVGCAENIEKMVTNTYTKRRHTMLEKLLRD